jgi:hypothetical protein
MTDLEKFVSILHSAGIEYFAYSDYDSVGDTTNYIVIQDNDISMFHKFITYEDNTVVQKYVSCNTEKEYESLDEIVREVMS